MGEEDRKLKVRTKKQKTEEREEKRGRKGKQGKKTKMENGGWKTKKKAIS